jgi:lysophospholipase L1-like esterase
MRWLSALLGLWFASCAWAQDYSVVLLGDSITAGWKSWGNLSQVAPLALDAGISGQTSSMMLARLQSSVLSHHPRTVVLLAGTNDTDIAAFKKVPVNFSYMREIIQRCEAAGAQVIVGTIPPAPEPEWDEYVQRWNAEVRLESAVYGYEVADYYPVFFTEGSLDPALFLDDHIHPSYAGFVRMGRVLFPMLHGGNGFRLN